MRGYLVAIRTRPRRRRASPIGSPPSRAATTMRQRAEAEVEQLVDLALGLLEQHVLAGDPDVGRAVLDVGGHVARPHRHDAGVLEQQLAVVRAHLARVDPEPSSRSSAPSKQRAARDGDRQPVGSSERLLRGLRHVDALDVERHAAGGQRRGRSGRAGRRSARRRRARSRPPGRRPRTPRPV